MSSVDFNELQKLENLAVATDSLGAGTANTFLTVASVTGQTYIADMNSNTVVKVLDTPKQASDFIDDSKAATLASFDLDLTAETLTLVFSETMDETSVAPTQFTLQSGTDLASAASHTLTAEVGTVRADDTTIVLSLVKADLEYARSPTPRVPLPSGCPRNPQACRG